MPQNNDITDFLAGKALEMSGIAQTYTTKLLQVSENITYAAFKNDDPGQKMILRINRPGYHSAGELEGEIEWMRRIRAETPLIVPTAIPGADGALIHSISVGNTCYSCVFFEFLSGKTPDAGDMPKALEYFYKLGKATAILHRQVRSWSENEKIKRFEWDCGSMIGRAGRWGYWKSAKDLTPYIENLLERTCGVIKKRLSSYGKGAGRFGLIHADLRLANLLVEDDTIKIIDFDDCGYGWFLHDLAAAVSFIETEPGTPELISAWIDGYGKVSALSTTDIGEIGTFIMQRRIQLMAWLASHTSSHGVKKLNEGFTQGTAAMAERYLSKYT